MCGIIGYTGNEQAAPLLVDGLKRLEYRGYDSAGIAVAAAGKLKVAKKQGHVVELESLVDHNGGMDGFMGIGHTRWATHGKPSDVNSHPHVSSSGKIAVVHNGIIENYAVLKADLEQKGYIFTSETDTEAVAHLIDLHYDGDLLAAVRESVKILTGAFALGVICADDPDHIIALRKDSPLVVGLGRRGNFIASDIPALLAHTRNIYRLNDLEIAVIGKNRVIVYDPDGNVINKEIQTIDWDIDSAEKGGYEHFMLKEIFEQPKVFGETIARRVRDGKVVLEELSMSDADIRAIERIYIVACGTAYYVGMAGRYVYEQLLRVPTEACMASEFRYCDPVLNDKTLVIVVSQSGTTEDSVKALREAKARGARTLGIVNVVGSTIADETDDVLYTWAGPEIAVASTKAYTTQLAVMYLLGMHLAARRQSCDPALLERLLADLKAVPGGMEEILEYRRHIRAIAQNYCSKNDVFFIGRNLDYAVALEGSLKFKEISYIHSEAYAAGELKHGPISLIEQGTPVVAVAATARLFDKLMSNAQEVITRGADVIALVTRENAERAAGAADVIVIPDIHELLTPCLSPLPLQLLAYYVAHQRGCNIDKPRNLAKSVTVE